MAISTVYTAQRDALERADRILADVMAMDYRKQRAVNVLELVTELRHVLAPGLDAQAQVFHPDMP